MTANRGCWRTAGTTLPVVTSRAIARAFRWLVVVALLGLAGQGAATAAAQTAHSPGLAFADARTWAVKWEDLLKAPKGVEVCNVSGTTARDPQAFVSEFVAGTAAPQRVVTVEFAAAADKPSGWQAGECRSVVLMPVSGKTLKSGSYTGVVSITSSVGIARRLVTITGPATMPTPATAKGATDTVALKAQRNGPFGTADGELKLLLKPATKDEKLTVPSDCDPPTSDGDVNCPFVGNLFNGTHVAKLFVGGGLDARTNQPTTLKLRLDDASEVGTYAGSLDLAQTPDPADDVKLSVSVRDGLGWALGALLLGGFISLGSQYGLRSSWPKGRMRRRYKTFAKKYTDAVAAFNTERQKGDGLDEDWKPPTPIDIKVITDALEDGIESYRKSTVYWDATNDAYQELDRSLALVDDDIECLKDPKRLPATLKALKKALDDLTVFLNTQCRTPGAPPFVIPAAALLKAPAPTLTVGQASATADAADSATELVASWRGVADEIMGYETWWFRLVHMAEVNEDGLWTDHELDVLRITLSRLAEVKHELATVCNASDLATLDIAGDLKFSYTNLAYLSGLHGGWPRRLDAQAQEPVSYELVGAMEIRAGNAPELAWSALQMSGVAHLLGSWLDGAAIESKSATTARLEDLGGIGIAALSLIVTIVVAVVTGLSLFYFDNADWGTTEDYLTVIVVAVAAQAMVQSIISAVGRLLPAAPKELITGPAAAILKPPAAPKTPVPATAVAA